MTTLGEQLPELTSQLIGSAGGLDRSAGIVAQAADRSETTSQAVAALIDEAGAAQNTLSEILPPMLAAGAQLPLLNERLETTIAALDGSAGDLDRAADRHETTSQAMAALAADAGAAQNALSEVLPHMQAASAQLPLLTERLDTTIAAIDSSALELDRVADRHETSSQTAAAHFGAAQNALSEILPHMQTAGAQLPLLTERLDTTIAAIDNSVVHLDRATDRHETSSQAAAELVGTAQDTLSEILPHMQTAAAHLPLLTERLDTTIVALDESASRIGETASTALEGARAAETAGQAAEIAVARTVAAHATMHETLQDTVQKAHEAAAELVAAGDGSIASQAALAGAIECVAKACSGLEIQLPAVATEFGEQVDRLAQQIIGLDQSAATVAENASAAAAEMALAQDAGEANRSHLEETVRQIADLADAMTGTLPPLSARISSVIDNLDHSASALAMIGASAGEALPTAAARLDEALAGLDSMVRVIGEAAETAASSIGEAAVTQSALSQTVQCMASVGEALPSLAMRLEGTLGALDRSADNICAAANDVAEAGRAISANTNGSPDEGGERRNSYGPPRPVPDASMRRLQSVASALALAGSGTHG